MAKILTQIATYQFINCCKWMPLTVQYDGNLQCASYCICTFTVNRCALRNLAESCAYLEASSRVVVLNKSNLTLRIHRCLPSENRAIILTGLFIFPCYLCIVSDFYVFTRFQIIYRKSIGAIIIRVFNLNI